MSNVIEQLISSDTYYIYNPLDLYDSRWQWDINKFNMLPTDKLILINCSSENWGMKDFIDSLYDTLNQHRDNFLILSHLPSDHFRRPNLIFYPYWYYYSIGYFTKLDLTNNQKKYKLSCLNHNPRTFRIYNYLILKTKEYYKDTILSMYADPSGSILRDDDYVLSTELQLAWDNASKELTDCLLSGFDNNTIHDAYTNSYVNLVTETTISSKFFITEKTWKPIACGQLFIVMGSQHTISHLREQGVDTFDDIIDHSYYDSEPDFSIRFNKFYQILDKLMLQDLYTININTANRRKENSRKFFAGEFDVVYNNIFLSEIREYKKNHLSE